MVSRLAFETLVRFAVVHQVPDAVHRVFENRSGCEHDHPNCRIDKRNDADSRYETGDLSSEAEVFE
jgi:hypothetical protein